MRDLGYRTSPFLRSAALVMTLAALAGCQGSSSTATALPIAPGFAPAVMAPQAAPAVGRAQPARTGAATAKVIDLTRPGAVVRDVARATIIDTRRIPSISDAPVPGPTQRIRNYLPPHTAPGAVPRGEPNGLPLGGTLEQPRVRAETLFAGIGQTGWVPPDPALAVGPAHIVTTVNQKIAFYTKGGTLQFAAELGSPGAPGFFEEIGAGNFVFDPKCFYDHLAQRFVVVAPEVYGSTEAWITIAVSDDADPNGVWFKYRTDAVITVGAQTFWWDYPGFGYDAQGYYVTCNLFGLSAGGWGGVGFRVFDKAPMLTGQPAAYSTLRDGNSASVQVAQHFGTPQAPYFVSFASGSAARIHAIRNPLTAPQLVTTDVAIPAFNGPGEAPCEGGAVSLVDSRIMNAHWRNGKLYAAHNASDGARNLARWYQFSTNNWPAAGGVSLTQSGVVDPGPGLHSYFPAIYSNQADEVGIVIGASSPTRKVGVYITGRRPSDPAGAVGLPVMSQLGTGAGAGRWGDYQDIAIDPVDDTRFWAIGEYNSTSGWKTWITSFRISDTPLIHAIPDDAGAAVEGDPRPVDVLANDYHSAGLPLTISGFDAAGIHGGSITRSVGTGPSGRDELLYSAPSGYQGPDSFTYTISDGAGTNTAAVSVEVYPASAFRTPEAPLALMPQLVVNYYALSAPSVLPDFSLLTSYRTLPAAGINIPSTPGTFSTSGRSDNVGAVWEGYLDIPRTDLYTLSTESDDGSRLWIGDQLIVDNDGLHGMQARSGTIGLRAGAHRIRVAFFESGGGAGMIVRLNGPGQPAAVIPEEMWFRDSPCPADASGDGLLDFADYLTFLNLFDAADPRADINKDGTIDFADYLEFLNLFDAGC
ncbi:MAG: hypothetical protein IT436_01950 [Phycisphaerales bacterium]|nr:hypothetical protein [Phycisphaerales bacterium]